MATAVELPKAAPFLIEQDYSAYTTEQHCSLGRAGAPPHATA